MPFGWTWRCRVALCLLTISLNTWACTPAPRSSQAPPAQARADSAALAGAATRFLADFDSLNWAGFTGALSDSVEIFWPRADTPGRLRGRTAVEGRFRPFFTQIRAARPGPPFLHLQVQALSVRTLGAVGLVSFELTDVPDTLGRRTLVFQQEHGAWRLIHLHASNLPLPVQR